MRDNRHFPSFFVPMSQHPPPWRPRRLFWPLGLMALVALISGKGQISVPFTFGLPSFDKLAHFGVFGLIMVSTARVGGERGRGFGWSLTGALTAVLFGLVDEILQGQNPHRTGLDVADWLADVTGALTAMFLWRGWDWGHRLLETPLRLPRPWHRRQALPESPPADPAPVPVPPSS